MEKRSLAEQRQRLDDAAAGAEHLVALIGDDHAGPHPRRRVIDDLVGQIMDINNSLADASVAEFIQHMIEQRPACHPHQRLWHPVGEGAHAYAQAGGEDHGFGGFDRHFQEILEPLFRERRVAQIISRRLAGAQRPLMR